MVKFADMDAVAILQDTSNRQYPLPEGPWLHYQEWHGNLFLHWEVDISWLDGLLPKGLTPHLINGTAWLTIVAFTVRKMRPRFLPPLPYLSNFHEVNFRTYVIRDGIPGIFFLSIEAGKAIPALMARLTFGLPYHKAAITREASHYIAKPGKDMIFDVQYTPGETIAQKSTLDYWLTERHSLYEENDGRITRLDIHHRPWPLQQLEVTRQELRYSIEGKQWPERAPDLCHFSPVAKVLLWGMKGVEP